MENQHLVSGQLKKHVTSMSYKLEPAIWSCDMGQWIPCFDMCQLIIIWMSNIREVHRKPKLHVCHVVQLRHRRHEYAPTSNTASHDNHEKINSWVSLCFPYGVWGSAWRPFGLPELHYNNLSFLWCQ